MHIPISIIKENKGKIHNFFEDNFIDIDRSYFHNLESINKVNIMLISDDELIVEEFLILQKKFNYEKILIITTNTMVVLKYGAILFESGVVFNTSIKYNIDIIFDAYMIHSGNFTVYRKIVSDIFKLSKTKICIISLNRTSVLLENFILSMSKEILWKKLSEFVNGSRINFFRETKLKDVLVYRKKFSVKK